MLFGRPTDVYPVGQSLVTGEEYRTWILQGTEFACGCDTPDHVTGTRSEIVDSGDAGPGEEWPLRSSGTTMNTQNLS